MALTNTNLQWLTNGEPATGDPTGAAWGGVLNRPLYELLQNDVGLDADITALALQLAALAASLGDLALTVRKITVADSPFTATEGDYIVADTSGGPIDIIAPTPVGTGYELFYVVDPGKNFETNNPVTILRNGNNIEGVADDLELDVDTVEVKFTWVGAPTDWNVSFTWHS